VFFAKNDDFFISLLRYLWWRGFRNRLFGCLWWHWPSILSNFQGNPDLWRFYLFKNPYYVACIWVFFYCGINFIWRGNNNLRAELLTTESTRLFIHKSPVTSLCTGYLGRLNIALVFSERNLGLVKSESATALASWYLQSFESVCRHTLLGRDCLLVQPRTTDHAPLEINLVCFSHFFLVFSDQLPFLISDLGPRGRNLRFEIFHFDLFILLILLQSRSVLSKRHARLTSCLKVSCQLGRRSACWTDLNLVTLTNAISIKNLLGILKKLFTPYLHSWLGCGGFPRGLKIFHYFYWTRPWEWLVCDEIHEKSSFDVVGRLTFTVLGLKREPRFRFDRLIWLLTGHDLKYGVWCLAPACLLGGISFGSC